MVMLIFLNKKKITKLILETILSEKEKIMVVMI